MLAATAVWGLIVGVALVCDVVSALTAPPRTLSTELNTLPLSVESALLPLLCPLSSFSAE